MSDPSDAVDEVANNQEVTTRRMIVYYFNIKGASSGLSVIRIVGALWN